MGGLARVRWRRGGGGRSEGGCGSSRSRHTGAKCTRRQGQQCGRRRRRRWWCRLRPFVLARGRWEMGEWQGRWAEADGGGRRRGARGPAARYSQRQGGHRHWGCHGCILLGSWEKGFRIGLAASVANCWTAPLGACIFISPRIASVVRLQRRRTVSAACLLLLLCNTSHARVACLVVAVRRERRDGRSSRRAGSCYFCKYPCTHHEPGDPEHAR